MVGGSGSFRGRGCGSRSRCLQHSGFLSVCVVVAVLAAGIHGDSNSTYTIGTGIADVTGPAFDIGMMGYAEPSQKSGGIHFRLRARAFIVADDTTNTRIVFVNVDACMVMQDVKIEVINQLQKQYGDMYKYDNVLLTGIHTHSGPGGFSKVVGPGATLLYDITTLGFVQESFDAVVNGIVAAIQRAHANAKPGGYIYVNSGKVAAANINRSPTSYLANPQAERDSYPDGDTDKDMLLLRFEDSTHTPIGTLNWFPVHGTSMNNTNKYISGDNKGYAESLFEQDLNGAGYMPGSPVTPSGAPAFIAAFAQANAGDVSPNTRGAFCPDGSACDALTSTCGGKNEMCRGIGPGKDMFESTKIIGTTQYTVAKSLFDAATTPLSGPTDFRHSFVDMTHVQVEPQYAPYTNDTNIHTCKPAIGDAFAAGTTDGHGALNFKQGGSTNPFLNSVVDLLIGEPTADQKACHAPKPIFLNVGELREFYPGWVHTIVPIQMLRIGQLAIVALPSEITTMAGRRLVKSVKEALLAAGFPQDGIVALAAISNAYTHYTATYEEYQRQRYEAASTIYGPHQLAAYQQLFSNMATAMATGASVDPGVLPTRNTEKQVSFVAPVLFDTHPPFSKFGDVVSDAKGIYSPGMRAEASFWAGNPRNNLMAEQSYLAVERKVGDRWTLVAADSHWETLFRFSMRDIIFGVATVSWDIPADATLGEYRLRHNGWAKSPSGDVSAYVGLSRSFIINTAAAGSPTGDVTTDGDHLNSSNTPISVPFALVASFMACVILLAF